MSCLTDITGYGSAKNAALPHACERNAQATRERPRDVESDRETASVEDCQCVICGLVLAGRWCGATMGTANRAVPQQSSQTHARSTPVSINDTAQEAGG